MRMSQAAPPKGIIALMGSGELAGTMVEVHKELISGLAGRSRAVFVDTPAGFQLNVDEISRRAVEFFRLHVQHPMEIVSFKSGDAMTPLQAEEAYEALREADFVLIGPGSPTYAVRNWQGTPIPEILSRRIEAGGRLVAASAAALTVGRFCLPVYEIYKVGEPLHWVEGIDVLGRFGLGLVVIPHWNNAEGGTHDTRFCYMGESRFRELESMLPEDVRIVGLDEHTACLLDFEREEAVVKGIGRVTLRNREAETVFVSGDRFPLDVLRGGEIGARRRAPPPEAPSPGPAIEKAGESFWDGVHALEAAFHAGMENQMTRKSTNALLDLDRLIWQAQQNLESPEFISQAREILRELIVAFGLKIESSPKDRAVCLAPLVEELLQLRQSYRESRCWQEADAIRERLERVNVLVEDTSGGSRWSLLP